MVCGLQKDYNLFLTFRTLKSKEIPSMPHVVCEACIGCKRTDCVDVCPAKEKALVMRPLEEQMPQQKNW